MISPFTKEAAICGPLTFSFAFTNRPKQANKLKRAANDAD